MKTEKNIMKIMEAGNTTEGQETKSSKYKNVEPITLDNMPNEAAFIRSSDVCKLLNISNSTLRNLRSEQAIPFYKLGGVFLYNKKEIMDYLAQNYSKRI